MHFQAFFKKCCVKSQKTVKITIVENHEIWPFRKRKTCHSNVYALAALAHVKQKQKQKKKTSMFPVALPKTATHDAFFF